MTFLFVIFTSALLLLQYKKEKRIFNLVTIFMGPYLVLVPINNWYVFQYGFNIINEQVLGMLMFAFALFFFGGKLVDVGKIKLPDENHNKDLLKTYDIGTMNIVLLVIGVLGLIKMFVLYRTGTFSSQNIDSSEGIMGEGLVGHLLLLSYSILPIIFLYWTYNKKKIQYLVSIILIVIVTFSSFIKYNIVGLFVSIFLTAVIYKRSSIRKAVILLFTLVVLVFVCNYALTFAAKGVEVQSKFYFGHLWAYMSGSLIYDNYIFTDGIRVGVDIGYKLMTFLCGFPNMFISKIFGNPIFPHVRQDDMPVGGWGETSNVVDAIGYLFPSKGDFFDYFLFAIVMVGIGFVFFAIYRRSISKTDRYNIFLVNFLCYFVFFSFFGTFYINSAPWEILIYSLIFPRLFQKHRIRLIWGN